MVQLELRVLLVQVVLKVPLVDLEQLEQREQSAQETVYLGNQLQQQLHQPLVNFIMMLQPQVCILIKQIA